MRTQEGIQRSFRRRIGLARQNKRLELAHRSPRGLASAELSLREPAHPRGTLSAAARPCLLYRFTSWEAARRKPRLLLRLSGLLLFRLPAVQFLELLFQLPPRFTRFELPA